MTPRLAWIVFSDLPRFFLNMRSSTFSVQSFYYNFTTILDFELVLSYMNFSQKSVLVAVLYYVWTLQKMSMGKFYGFIFSQTKISGA